MQLWFGVSSGCWSAVCSAFCSCFGLFEPFSLKVRVISVQLGSSGWRSCVCSVDVSWHTRCGSDVAVGVDPDCLPPIGEVYPQMILQVHRSFIISAGLLWKDILGGDKNRWERNADTARTFRATSGNHENFLSFCGRSQIMPQGDVLGHLHVKCI